MDMNSLLLFMAKEVTALLIIGGVARVIFQPFLDNYFFNSTKRKQVEYKEWLAREVFADRMKRVDDIIEMAIVNKDVLTGVREMIDAHGSMLSNHEKALNQMETFRESVNRIERAFDAIERLVGETRDIAFDVRSRLEERDKWDGRNRRGPDHH